MSDNDDEGMLRDLLDLEEGLTDWELKFIEDLAHNLFDLKFDLTPGQRNKLVEIWKEKGR